MLFSMCHVTFPLSRDLLSFCEILVSVVFPVSSLLFLCMVAFSYWIIIFQPLGFHNITHHAAQFHFSRFSRFLLLCDHVLVSFGSDAFVGLLSSDESCWYQIWVILSCFPTFCSSTFRCAAVSSFLCTFSARSHAFLVDDACFLCSSHRLHVLYWSMLSVSFSSHWFIHSTWLCLMQPCLLALFSLFSTVLMQFSQLCAQTYFTLLSPVPSLVLWHRLMSSLKLCSSPLALMLVLNHRRRFASNSSLCCISWATQEVFEWTAVLWIEFLLLFVRFYRVLLVVVLCLTRSRDGNRRQHGDREACLLVFMNFHPILCFSSQTRSRLFLRKAQAHKPSRLLSACSLKSLATSFVFLSQLQMVVVLPSVWWLPRQTGWNSTGTFKLFAGFAICQWLPGSAGQPACSKGIQVPWQISILERRLAVESQLNCIQLNLFCGRSEKEPLLCSFSDFGLKHLFGLVSLGSIAFATVVVSNCWMKCGLVAVSI